jgi:NADH:ubiquinone oxidoreductase subunit
MNSQCDRLWRDFKLCSPEDNMSLFSEIFSWWGGNTWGTRWLTFRQGKFVGNDELGNRYYVQRSGIGPLGVPRRWVIYRDSAEASLVPPEWHGWMHYTTDDLPNAEQFRAQDWHKPHLPNMTGTPQAYRPPGSILSTGQRAASASDYGAWKPD